MTVGRYLEEDGADAAAGLATDEMLMHRATAEGSPALTLRLYTYRSHCALVGRFQDLTAELDVDACRAEGISVNRRPTGGGAILMGEDQLGVALAVPASSIPSGRDLTGRFEWFSRGLVNGLRDLGVPAEFHPRNDVMVGGRKVAGTGLCEDENGGVLFHASLLCDLDIPLMLRALRIPVQKIADKPIRAIEERTTTLARELGRPVAPADVRSRLRAAFAPAFEVDLVSGGLSEEELRETSDLVARRYGTPDWLFERSPPTTEALRGPRPVSLADRFAVLRATRQVPGRRDVWGESVTRTPAGVVRLHVALSGGVIKSLWLTGDFFATTPTVTGLESRLKWTLPEEDAVRKELEAEYALSGGISGLSARELTDAVLSAAGAAKVG